MRTLFVAIQYLLPQHLLSRCVGRLAECRTPWLKNLLIDAFIRRYKVDMSQAADPDPRSYPNFNAFFTRPLRADARPLEPAADAVLCPADGAISEVGRIEAGQLLQAKGQTYSLTELVGDTALAASFQGGSFATIYLSPRDYHRVHMPIGGTLTQMLYVPGALFSVNQATADQVPALFARNERAVCLFDTEAGPMAVILVGAMIVAGIETVWAGQVSPPPRQLAVHDYTRGPSPVRLERGEEMGRFKLGSTVIVLFGPGQAEWAQGLINCSPVQLGQRLGSLTATPARTETPAPH